LLNNRQRVLLILRLPSRDPVEACNTCLPYPTLRAPRRNPIVLAIDPPKHRSHPLRGCTPKTRRSGSDRGCSTLPHGILDTSPRVMARSSESTCGRPGDGTRDVQRREGRATGCCSTTQDVHETMRVWHELEQAESATLRIDREEKVRRVFEESGYLNWSSTIA
jgi:hypothetical protein